MASKTASEIAQQINNSNITVTIVELFIILSKPLRHSLRNYFTGQLQYLSTVKKSLLSKVGKFDIIYNKLNEFNGILTQVLAPVDRLYRSFPLDEILLENPDIARVFDDILKFIPINIPETLQINDVDAIEILDGINSYGDLRDKIDELNFRVARSLSIRENLTNQTSQIDTTINKLQSYIDLIELLDTSGF
ncbi:MAG: hypothetical protein M0Q88_07030 [Bacilli bacterium]|nr:hypothetical protein [Bacilli bacterium]